MSGEYSNELRNAKPVDFLVSQAILLFTQGGAGEEEGREWGKSVGNFGSVVLLCCGLFNWGTRWIKRLTAASFIFSRSVPVGSTAIEIIYFPKFRFFTTVLRRSCGAHLVVTGGGFRLHWSHGREEAKLEGRGIPKKKEISLQGWWKLEESPLSKPLKHLSRMFSAKMVHFKEGESSFPQEGMNICSLHLGIKGSSFLDPAPLNFHYQ